MVFGGRMAMAAAAVLLAQGALVARSEGRLVDVNGFEMYVDEAGAGEPLVLLHAFGGCGSVQWGAFVGELAKEYRVIVPDLRGHGRSINPSGEFTHRQSAADVIALANALGIDRFHAMGTSTGGMTLLHVAVQEPARVQSLVLIGTTPEFGDRARMIMRSTVEGLPPEMEQLYRQCLSRGDDQLSELAAQFAGFADSYDDMNLTEQQLSQITIPTLIVHGDSDAIFPIEVPVALYRSIPDSALWIVPGGDHVPIYGPVAPEFLRVALNHLGTN